MQTCSLVLAANAAKIGAREDMRVRILGLPGALERSHRLPELTPTTVNGTFGVTPPNVPSVIVRRYVVRDWRLCLDSRRTPPAVIRRQPIAVKTSVPGPPVTGSSVPVEFLILYWAAEFSESGGFA